VIKAEFSHNPSEITLILKCDAQETFMIINVENSSYFCGNKI